MKKIVTLLSVMVLVLGCLFPVTGCGKSYKEIHTYEELKAIPSYSYKADRHNYKLMNDIDCNFETLEDPLSVGDFDGQGFTIKNLYVKPLSGYEGASIFHEKIDSICNVNFDNIIVEGESEELRGAAVVLAGECEKIENVHVTNSKVTCNLRYGKYVGGIYAPLGFTAVGSNWERLGEKLDCPIVGCTVKGTEITVASTGGADIYVGGIAGFDNNVSNCNTTECIIKGISGTSNVAYIGGVVGGSSGEVKNCYAKDNEILTSSTETSKAFSNISGCEVVLGGGVGYLKEGGNISYCYAENNTITAECSSRIFAGGMLGWGYGASINQSYAKNNTITMNGLQANEEVERRAGGMVGAMKNSSISSCFAYNDVDIIEESTAKEGESKIGGFIGTLKDCTVTHCAAYNKNLIADNKDEFSCSESEKISNCCISAETFGNCNLITINPMIWESSSVLQSTLLLSGENWSFSDKLPVLVF